VKRRLAVVVVTGLATLGLSLAYAGKAAAATYTVCGYGSVVPIIGGGSCMTLDDAIAAAKATPDDRHTIQMLPGAYCPIDLEGTFGFPIKFVGVGVAAEDLSGSPISFSGPEASLTTIEYDSTHCGTLPSSLVNVNAAVTSGVPFIFQNLTIDGTAGGQFGFFEGGVQANVQMRDVIVQHVTGFPDGIGLHFQGLSGSDLIVENSAFLDNTYGLDLNGAVASIFDTTVARNTTTGLSLNNYLVSMGADTISNNGTGVNATGAGSLQIVNSIVAGNAADCGSTNGWESEASLPNSFNNLVGSFTCPVLGAHDIRDTSVTMPDVALNGGPTPSIMPPSSAQGAGAPTCGFSGVDQREFLDPATTTCDMGAVQAGASGATALNIGDVDLGTVTTGSTTAGAVLLSVVGSDLVGVSGVSISGAGWTISSDDCTYAVMEKALFGSCSVGVSVHPTGGGTWDGTLTIHTTAGDRTAQLHAQTPATPQPPSIASFTPSTGGMRATVTITGTNFLGVTAVKLNGTAVGYSVISATKLVFTVPVGATSGAIQVVSPAGTATSSGTFTVLSPPTITSFSPSSGPVGTVVTVTGTNLDAVVGVQIGGIITVPSSHDATHVVFAVPPGARSGRITILTLVGAVSTVGTLTVTS
jgi:hypothetical protein